LYDWLKEKVDNEEYPNVSQAVLGVLLSAKTEEERNKLLSEYPTFKDLEKRLQEFKKEIIGELKT